MNTMKHVVTPPNIYIMDNEASTEIKRSIARRNGTYQLAEPHNHRTLVADQAIQKYKEHFIAGLCSTDAKFQLNQLDRLIVEANLTLNLLRMSRIKNVYQHTLDYMGYMTIIRHQSHFLEHEQLFLNQEVFKEPGPHMVRMLGTLAQH